MGRYAKPHWQFAHKSGRDVWEAVIGQDRCPYCRHRQDQHCVSVEPGTLEITVLCDHCGPFGVSRKTCMVVPGPAARMARFAPSP